VAFVAVAAADFGNWVPSASNEVLQCEIDSDERQVVVGLLRSRKRSVESESYTFFNLQMAFERPRDNPVQHATIELGDEGAETPVRMLEFVSGHPSVGPVLDSVQPDTDVYLD
jgi:hypothetical protein